MRSARAAEAERRSRVADDARSSERIRIARALHDVATHHVTEIGGAVRGGPVPDRRTRPPRPGPDERQRHRPAGITDLRHLLDLLHPDHGTGHGGGPGGEDRAPPVGRLFTLVEQTRRAGRPVEYTEEGTPPVSTGSADLVAYRVVQETLTNALKYDHGSRTSVLVRHGERDLTVEVVTDGSGSRDGSPGGSGRGLGGLRERVGVLGGDFSAGRCTGGGFLVRARIPARSPV